MRAAPFIALFAAFLASGCANIKPFEAHPHTQFHPAPNMPHYGAILPGGVAVLYEKPRCDYVVLGEAWVTQEQIDITPSRIEALQQEAARVGADAIIVHPNRMTCANGREPAICAGRGEYSVASVIRYTDKLTPPHFTAVPLEHSNSIGYDSQKSAVEPQNLLPEYPL